MRQPCSHLLYIGIGVMGCFSLLLYALFAPSDDRSTTAEKRPGRPGEWRADEGPGRYNYFFAMIRTESYLLPFEAISDLAKSFHARNLKFGLFSLCSLQS